MGISDAGRAKALEIGKRMAAPDRILTSPARRCIETVEALFPHARPPMVADPRLWEIDTGFLSGRLESEVESENPGHLRAWREAPDAVRPGEGESVHELSERAVAAIGDLLAGIDMRETVLVVTHGGPIRALTCHYNGAPLARFHDIAVPNLGLFVLRSTSAGGRLEGPLDPIVQDIAL